VKIPTIYFCIGSAILLFAPPLFENDHFRYIWEAKVLLKGENPYTQIPNSKELNHIYFMKKDLIGFPHLTTIYPPLALLWFATGAVLKFPYAMIVLKLLNSGLVFLLFKFLSRYKISSFHLILIFPFLQKEFISSIHIDLFAISFFIISFFMMTNKTKFKYPFIMNLLSFWTKFLSILSVPFYLLALKKQDRFSASTLLPIISIPVGLILFFFLFVRDINLLIGVKAFTASWFWHPGFFTVLTDLFLIEHHLSRRLTAFAFILFYISVLWVYTKVPVASRKEVLSSTLLLVFSGLIFFSPVFNPWYAIWFLPFGLIRKNTWAILYTCFSALAYTAYGKSEFLYISQLINHLTFLPLAWKEFNFLLKKHNFSNS
jgi:hypothetical protein